MSRRIALVALTAASVAACASEPPPAAPPPPPPPPPVATAPAPPPPAAPRTLSRADFNRIAVRANLPVFWVADTNGDGVPQRDELRALLFYPTSDSVDLEKARDTVLAFDPDAMPQGLPADEVTRRKLVAEDLDQGAPTLMYWDARGAPEASKTLLRHMLAAAHGIDELYATVRGARALAARVPADDVSSQSLFRRDWGPRCAAAKTIKNPACSAIPGAPQPINDAYPAAVQSDPGFCAALDKNPDSRALLDPFTVVREREGKLLAVPYSEAFAAPMRGIAAELRAAADDVTDPGEAPLKAYLAAAATSFTTNDWGPADEAWSRMNAQNSKWYVRVAPDEVLADPCNRKAQFHLTFARIDQGSLEWQRKLAPVEQDMERTVGKLAGAPYAARKVTFHLPDFIQIVLNAGDDRAPVGGTAGESLPNWGKVEREGRGRTVAMTNLGTDPDSLEISRKRVESTFDAESRKAWTEDPEPALLVVILHEATHNLGPTYEYTFKGKKGAAVFGGGLAAMLEELKAETGAMFWIDWLEKKGIVGHELARRSYGSWLSWALRHISAGMHTGAEHQAYSQLAAIEVGYLMDEGAVVFDPNATAADGTSRGAFSLRFEKLAPAFEKLFKVVLAIKARNDKPGAEALVARYVDGPVVPHALIAERMLRYPQATYVYSVDR